jgi:hypothetical protein
VVVSPLWVHSSAEEGRRAIVSTSLHLVLHSFREARPPMSPNIPPSHLPRAASRQRQRSPHAVAAAPLPWLACPTQCSPEPHSSHCEQHTARQMCFASLPAGAQVCAGTACGTAGSLCEDARCGTGAGWSHAAVAGPEGKGRQPLPQQCPCMLSCAQQASRCSCRGQAHHSVYASQHSSRATLGDLQHS